jgi:hypothetical protein
MDEDTGDDSVLSSTSLLTGTSRGNAEKTQRVVAQDIGDVLGRRGQGSDAAKVIRRHRGMACTAI